jgi:hypothetical protein
MTPSFSLFYNPKKGRKFAVLRTLRTRLIIFQLVSGLAQADFAYILRPFAYKGI